MSNISSSKVTDTLFSHYNLIIQVRLIRSLAQPKPTTLSMSVQIIGHNNSIRSKSKQQQKDLYPFQLIIV